MVTKPGQSLENQALQLKKSPKLVQNQLLARTTIWSTRGVRPGPGSPEEAAHNLSITYRDNNLCAAAAEEETLVRDVPRFGPLSFPPVSAKELKERTFQGVL